MYKKYNLVENYQLIDAGAIGEWFIIEIRDFPDDHEEISGYDRFYVAAKGYMINYDTTEPDDDGEMFYMKYNGFRWSYRANHSIAAANVEEYKEELRKLMKVQKTELYKAVYDV